MDWNLQGSVLRGDVRAASGGVRTRLEVESDDAREDVEEVVRLAENGCFIAQMIQEAVELQSHVEISRS